MKTSRFFALMATVIMMSSLNANAAEGPRDKRNDKGNNKEIHFNGNTGRLENRNDRTNPNNDRMKPHNDRKDYRPNYNDDRRSHDSRYDIRGYEDRVRFENNRWHYRRDGRWYSYDHYIAPSYYYSQPLSTFGKAVVGAAVVGAVISALAH